MAAHPVDVRPATAADAEELARTMRRLDRLETVQWTANAPGLACASSVRQSDVAFAVRAADGELLGVYGAKADNVLENTAVLWGLSTEAADRHRVAYVANSKMVLDAIFRAMPDVQEFHNWVSDDYPAAQRWVEWMGGTFALRGSVRGYGNSSFREFYIPNPHFNAAQPTDAPAGLNAPDGAKSPFGP